MTIDAFLARYEELLTRRAEADVQIKVLEKRMELLTRSAGAAMSVDKSATQSFIDKHETKLDADDIEFLRSEYRLVGEVVARTEISASTIKRLANSGKITEGPKTKAGYRQFSTLSVMEYLLSDQR